MSKMILTVSGPEHAGKKHVMSAVYHTLQELGMHVIIVGGEEHLHGKAELDEEGLKNRLDGVEILIMDQRTT